MAELLPGHDSGTLKHTHGYSICPSAISWRALNCWHFDSKKYVSKRSNTSNVEIFLCLILPSTVSVDNYFFTYDCWLFRQGHLQVRSIRKSSPFPINSKRCRYQTAKKIRLRICKGKSNIHYLLKSRYFFHMTQLIQNTYK